MSKILVLQGVPASGKSTFAREFASKDHSYVIVNRDAIREGRGEYWIPEQEDYISDVEQFQIEAALKKHLNVIIDATNLNPKTITKWKTIAEKHNAEIEFKLFKIDFKTALERDSKRVRPVGEKVLKRFFKDYFPEELCEFTDKRKIIEFDPIKSDVIVCDIDGTIALRTNRSPFDYSKVKTDIFDPRMKQLLFALSKCYSIIFVSGREGTDQCRQDTEKWIEENFLGKSTGIWKLLMRKPGDYRNDAIVKKEIYDNTIRPFFNVVCAFDDRNRVVDMWRNEGILCSQVYYGDF